MKSFWCNSYSQNNEIPLKIWEEYDEKTQIVCSKIISNIAKTFQFGILIKYSVAIHPVCTKNRLNLTIGHIIYL